MNRAGVAMVYAENGAYEKENIELLGRRRIYTDVEEITEGNIIQVLQDALNIHQENAREIAYLLRYEKGVQPLQRKKTVRSDIDIKVSDNIANQVTEFKLGYNWGNPISLVQRGNKDLSGNDADSDDDAISMLNEMNEAEAVFAKDQELARYIEICGIGFQMIDIKREYEGCSVFDIDTLNPLYTFIVYRNDIRETPMMSCTYRRLKNGDRYFTCITPKTRYEIRNELEIVNGEKKSEKWVFGPRNGETNPLGEIPVVEFVRAYDRMGCFERHISDMDALNVEVSDFANSVAQDTQSLWWGNDFEFPKDPLTGEARKPISGQWIMTSTTPSGSKPMIQALASPFSYDGVQQNIESKRNLILQKCYVPLQTDPGGGSTASAMSMSSGWSAAESAACKEEQIVKRSKMQVVKLELLAIQKSPDVPAGSPLLELKLSDIQPKFTRLKTFDLGTKTNAMVAMIKSGIHGRIAMQTVDLFPDVAQAWADSKNLIEKYQKSLFEEKQPQQPQEEKPDMPDLTDQTGNSPILDGMNTDDTASRM